MAIHRELGEITTSTGTRASAVTSLPVYSVTKHRGFVPSLEYFKKQVYSRDLAGYQIVESGEFAYATIHLDEGSIGIAPERCLISPMYTAFRVASTEVHPPYLLRYMKSTRAIKEYSRLGQGSAERRRSISLDRLGQLKIPVPTMGEQRRIADILDRADALRAKRREALAHLDDLTQSIFLDMFGDPVADPKHMPMKTLAELGDLDRGVSKHRPRNDPRLLGGSYPLIQTGDVANSRGRIESFSATYSEIGLSQSRLWPAGTLCITIAANIAKTGVLGFPACFPDSVVGFTSDPPTSIYVRTWFGFMQRILESSAPMSAQRNINLAILRSLSIAAPDAHMLACFAQKISAAETGGSEASEHLSSLDDLFYSLQHRAFAGLL